MRKLAFALFVVSFAALPSVPAAANCSQAPCAGYVQQPAWNPCCNNTGLVYWVQQVAQPCCYAQPAYVSPCCAQPYYYRHHHRTFEPAVYRPHRPHFRPHHRLHRHAVYRPHMRPLVRPMLRPLHRSYRAPMFRPHRPMMRPMHRVVQKTLHRPMLQRPHHPMKLKPKK